MRRWLGVILLLGMVAVPVFAVSPPQYTMQRTLKASIGASPFVSVGEVREVDGAYVVDVTSALPEVALGLDFILTKDYAFGGIQLTVRVLDGQGNPIKTPDTPVPADPVGESKRYVEAALAHNPLFAGFADSFLGSYMILARPIVVQFVNDNIGDPHGNTNLIAADAFDMVCRDEHFGGQVRPFWGTASAQESFGEEGILPAVAHSRGLFDSMWTTDVWILSDGATSVDLWFHRIDMDNSNAAKVTVDLVGPVTPIADVVATVFKTSGSGALRYRANGPVRVVGKTSCPAKGGGTSAQVARGVPLLDAAPGGAAGTTLSMVADQRAGFRANVGLINAAAAPATVRVMIAVANGKLPLLFGPITIELPPFGVTQFNNLLGVLDTVDLHERAGVIVTAEVVSDTGALIAYLCDVDNTTNAPAYQEAFPGEPTP